MTDYPSRIPYARALEILRAVAANSRLPDENIATSRADGRISAADLIAPLSLPPFANSSMDGFAVRHADTLGEDVYLQLVGEQFAGDSWSGTLTAGHCLRITTGAPLPAGADTVVPKEDADEQAGLVHLRTRPTLGGRCAWRAATCARAIW